MLNLMAAKHPGVAQEIKKALGAHPERGTLAQLAKDLGVTPTSVTRWYKLESSPEPSLWAAIEHYLDLHAGTLERASNEGVTAANQTAATSTPLDLEQPTNAQMLEVLEQIRDVVRLNYTVLSQLAKREGVAPPVPTTRSSDPPPVPSGRRRSDRS